MPIFLGIQIPTFSLEGQSSKAWVGVGCPRVTTTGSDITSLQRNLFLYKGIGVCGGGGELLKSGMIAPPPPSHCNHVALEMTCWGGGGLWFLLKETAGVGG
ncbi:UNVERIFIED_CONTAM: hypothetical protein K2H54_015953 [Gekko kuhli]